MGWIFGVVRGPRGLGFMLAVMLASAGAEAKDLKRIAEFVAPAYIAMNFAVVCAPRDPTFLAQTSGPRGHAVNYADHVKDEAIASLSHDEATMALKTAADTARDVALGTLRPLNSQDPVVEAARINAWCGNEARAFIRAFIEEHDANHERLLSRMREARQ